mmetsp:Transcript_18337/g.58309  ORF Transcript_18337/g.58309 Transcript_18337/m.58309 type:complete len:331 (-) Transcript_18337:211-1203(-)
MSPTRSGRIERTGPSPRPLLSRCSGLEEVQPEDGASCNERKAAPHERLTGAPGAILKGASKLPKIGDWVEGRITKVLSRVGVLVDIGAMWDAFLPVNSFGSLKRPHVGYQLSFLEVMDVDPDAHEEQQRILLSGDECINLTPSPLLITPTSSQQSTPQAASPESSCPPSPQAADSHVQLCDDTEDPIRCFKHPSASATALDVPKVGPAPGTVGTAEVAELRKTLLSKAKQLGVENSRLASALQSLSALAGESRAGTGAIQECAVSAATWRLRNRRLASAAPKPEAALLPCGAACPRRTWRPSHRCWAPATCRALSRGRKSDAIQGIGFIE